MKYDYDLIVVGSGPAGFSAAIQTTKFGKKVLLVEVDEKYLGGAWINSGTVPSKALRETANVVSKFTGLFGNLDGKKPYERYKMADLLKFKNQVVEYENSEVKRNLIKNEVHTARGYGKLVDKNTIEVADQLGNNKRYTSKHILLCTGSKPEPPKNFEIDNKIIFDTTSLLELSHVPRRLVIIGSGVNAIEYATIFASLGTKVNILNSNQVFMPFLDEEIRREFNRAMAAHRLVSYANVEVLDVGLDRLRNCTRVTFREKGSREKQVIETEQVIHFGVRKPNTKNLGLEEVGVSVDKEGFVKVDGSYKTNVDNIYAAGDMIGFPGLASASFTQGRLASCNMYGNAELKLKGSHPYGIYSIPEISSIGLTEKEAIDNGIDVTVGRAYYSELTKSSVSNNSVGLLKLVFESSSLKLVGIHIVGEGACDLIHIGQAVMNLGGSINYFVDHILNYPTYSEAYRIAAFNGLNRVNKAGVKYRDETD